MATTYFKEALIGTTVLKDVTLSGGRRSNLHIGPGAPPEADGDPVDISFGGNPGRMYMDVEGGARRMFTAEPGSGPVSLYGRIKHRPGFRDATNQCPDCGFNAWDYQDACPRCHAKLKIPGRAPHRPRASDKTSKAKRKAQK